MRSLRLILIFNAIACSSAQAFPNVHFIEGEVPFNQVVCTSSVSCEISEGPAVELTVSSISSSALETKPLTAADATLVRSLSDRSQFVLNKAYFAAKQNVDRGIATSADIDFTIFDKLFRDQGAIKWLPLSKRPVFRGEERDFAAIKNDEGQWVIGFYALVVQQWLHRNQNIDAILLHELILNHQLQSLQNRPIEQEYSISSVLASWMKLGRISRIPQLATSLHLKMSLVYDRGGDGGWIRFRLPIATPIRSQEEQKSLNCRSILGGDWMPLSSVYPLSRESNEHEYFIHNRDHQKELSEKSARFVSDLPPDYSALDCIKYYKVMTPFDSDDSDNDGIRDLVDHCANTAASQKDILDSLLNYGKALGCPNLDATLGFKGGEFCDRSGCYFR